MKYPVPLVPMRDATVPMHSWQGVKLYPDGLIPADFNVSLQMSPTPTPAPVIEQIVTTLYDVTLPIVWCDGLTPAVGATVTWGEESAVVGDDGTVTFYAQPAGTYLMTVSSSLGIPGAPAAPCDAFDNEVTIPPML